MNNFPLTKTVNKFCIFYIVKMQLVCFSINKR